MPQNLDDTRARCPGYESLETLPTGANEPVTILTYQRYKFKLYQATSTLTTAIYTRQILGQDELITRVESIHLQVVEIWNSVPPELRLSSFKERTWSAEEDNIHRVFQLQALSLQLLYDNIQLILHRPLLQYEVMTPDQRALETVDTGRDNSTITDGSQQGEAARRKNRVITSSRSQMWESAMRTSRLSELPHTLRLAKNTHAAAYIAIQAFTAGVALGLFAISSPFSRRSQIAKQAVGRLIRAPKSLGYHTAASEQYGLILHDLIQLVFKAEMRCLESAPDTEHESLRDDWEMDHGDSSTPSIRQTPVLNPHPEAHSRPITRSQSKEDSRGNHMLPSLPSNDSHDHFDFLDLPPENAHALLGEVSVTEAEANAWFTMGSLEGAMTSLQQHGKQDTQIRLTLHVVFADFICAVFKDHDGGDRGGSTFDRRSGNSAWERAHPDQVNVNRNTLPSTVEGSSPGFTHVAGAAALSNVGQLWVWEDFFNGSEDVPGHQADVA